jgi:hypothetical protein
MDTEVSDCFYFDAMFLICLERIYVVAQSSSTIASPQPYHQHQMDELELASLRHNGITF